MGRAQALNLNAQLEESGVLPPVNAPPASVVPLALDVNQPATAASAAPSDPAAEGNLANTAALAPIKGSEKRNEAASSRQKKKKKSKKKR